MARQRRARPCGGVVVALALALSVSLALLGLTGCSGVDGREQQSALQLAGTADDVLVTADAVTEHVELPGIKELDRLSEEGRAAVLSRANSAACDCGCLGHSVARCLNQREPCDVAARLARSFVSDVLGGESLPAERTEGRRRKRAKGSDDTAAGKAAQDTAAGKAAQDTAAGKAARDTAAGKAARDTAAGKAARDTAADKAADDTAAGKAAEDTTADAPAASAPAAEDGAAAPEATEGENPKP